LSDDLHWCQRRLMLRRACFHLLLDLLLVVVVELLLNLWHYLRLVVLLLNLEWVHVEMGGLCSWWRQGHLLCPVRQPGTVLRMLLREQLVRPYCECLPLACICNRMRRCVDGGCLLSLPMRLPEFLR
jgi:hypothetical protein